MTLKTLIGPIVTGVLTSPGLRDGRRRVNALKRRLHGASAQVHFFHHADDPYAHLMLQALPQLTARYAVDLRMHLASAPSDAAAKHASSQPSSPRFVLVQFTIPLIQRRDSWKVNRPSAPTREVKVQPPACTRSSPPSQS